MTGVSRLDRVRNEVVRTRTGVRRELAARVVYYLFILFFGGGGGGGYIRLP